ncbi:MAG: heme-binding domain-containing protein [Bacteroidota bacterium]
MKPFVRAAAVVCGAGVLLIQLIRPEMSNPPTAPELGLDSGGGIGRAELGALRRACYDCHSNRTVWPWYAYVSPVSWLVARDVEEGRRRLNFSTWNAYPVMRRISLLGSIWDEVAEGGMPLPSYLWMHPSAELTPKEKEQILRWAEEEQDRLAGAKE